LSIIQRHAWAEPFAESPTAITVDPNDLRTRAEAGDPEAQTTLGLLMMAQRVAGASESDGLGWIRSAAESGHAPAEFVLGTSLLSDPTASAKWLTRSATHGCAGAAGILALSYLGDQPAFGSRWLRYAAEQGDRMSQIMIGQAYGRGAYGLSVDKINAFAWLTVGTLDLDLQNAPLLAAASFSLTEISAALSPDDLRAAQDRTALYRSRYANRTHPMCGDAFPPVQNGGRSMSGEAPPTRTADSPSVAVTSSAELKKVLASAKQQTKPAVVVTVAAWAIADRTMEQETFTEPSVVSLLKGVVFIMLDVTSNAEDIKRVLAGYGVNGAPAFLAFDRNGDEILSARSSGYMATPRFVEWLNRVLEDNRR